MTVHTWQPGMFERPCGGCTMCCKLPEVPDLEKPAGVWCRHCNKGKGCTIYAERPEGCRAFMCLWKVMPDFPEEMRPDKSKVLWQMTEDGAAAVAITEYPSALGNRAQQRLAERFAREGIRVLTTVKGSL